MDARNPDGKLIYMDQQQCADFGVSYFHPTRLTISADVLLRSKSYDEYHREFLAPFGSAQLILVRTEDQGPGWWLATTANGHNVTA